MMKYASKQSADCMHRQYSGAWKQQNESIII